MTVSENVGSFTITLLRDGTGVVSRFDLFTQDGSGKNLRS